MKRPVFERKIAAAGYVIVRIDDIEKGVRRPLYESTTGAPLVSVNARGDEVDDLQALAVLAYLDEEGYLQND